MKSAYDQICEVISLKNEISNIQAQLDDLKKQTIPPQEPEKREAPVEPLPPHYEEERGSVTSLTVPHRRRANTIDYSWSGALKLGVLPLTIGLSLIFGYFQSGKESKIYLWIALAFFGVLVFSLTILPFVIFLYNLVMMKNGKLNNKEKEAYESQKNSIEAIEKENELKREKYKKAVQKYEDDIHYLESQYPVLVETYQKQMAAYKNSLSSLEKEINKKASELDNATAELAKVKGSIPDEYLESEEMMCVLQSLAKNDPTASVSEIVNLMYRELEKLKPLGIFSVPTRHSGERLEYIVKHNPDNLSEQLVYEASGDGRPKYFVSHDQGSDRYDVFSYGDHSYIYKVTYDEMEDCYVVESKKPDPFSLHDLRYFIKKRFVDSDDYFICAGNNEEAIWRIGKLEDEN